MESKCNYSYRGSSPNYNLHLSFFYQRVFCLLLKLLICLQNMKWELVDLGSLNGTLLNSQPISNPDSGIRQLSDPVELASGDVITLGTSSTVYVS